MGRGDFTLELVRTEVGGLKTALVAGVVLGELSDDDDGGAVDGLVTIYVRSVCRWAHGMVGSSLRSGYCSVAKAWGWLVEVHSLSFGFPLALEPGVPERVLSLLSLGSTCSHVALDDWGNEPGDEGFIDHDASLALWMSHFI